jgi:hypothetical protein
MFVTQVCDVALVGILTELGRRIKIVFECEYAKPLMKMHASQNAAVSIGPVKSLSALVAVLMLAIGFH